MMRQLRLFPLRVSAGFVLGCFLAFAALGAEGDNEILWTDTPVRVDRASQTYERLPPRDYYPRLPDKIVMGARPDILDGGSFRVDGELYLFRRIIAPPVDVLCTGHGGRRWTCGRQSMLQLRSALAGQTLRCATWQVARGVKLVECRTPAGDPELMQISRGLAIANSGHALLEKQDQLRRAHVGLWDNEECRAEIRNCW